MLDGARNYIALSLGPVQAASGKYDFVQSEAENLKLLEDASVDLVISGVCSDPRHIYALSDGFPIYSQLRHHTGSIGKNYGQNSPALFEAMGLSHYGYDAITFLDRKFGSDRYMFLGLFRIPVFALPNPHTPHK